MTPDQAIDMLDMQTYPHAFGKSSRANLRGVLPSLVSVAELAIKLCPYDGTVLAGGGLRELAAQKQYVANGTSWTLNSRHLKQADGYSHAIDLIALTDGKIDWQNMTAFRAMAEAVQTASAILSVPVRQGCDWDCDGILGESATKEWDWPHFENPKELYLPQATKLMNEHRAKLGLDRDQSIAEYLAVIDEQVRKIREAMAA